MSIKYIQGIKSNEVLIMVKVITYGTFDMLHFGHIRLLERARNLGDYLIVAVTSDDYDKKRGKINVEQSLNERIEGVKSTGLADEIIVEEYSGQKIEDIIRLNVDIFTVGSDWTGQFDYLNEYCKVVYLDRTEGISSSQIRTKKKRIKIGLVGDTSYLNKFYKECSFVNGAEIVGICTGNISELQESIQKLSFITESFDDLLNQVDVVYVCSHPTNHYTQVKAALSNRKHVLCESPSALSVGQYEELLKLAKDNNCIFIDSVKTAFATAYSRMIWLIKSGIIGDIISVDAVCTSLHDFDISDTTQLSKTWNSICAWGPTALLPVFQILGVNYKKKSIATRFLSEIELFDVFTKIDFVYEKAVGSIIVGKGIKSEGELIISGTKGYVYVPAPWWKTDYFEVRYENSALNKRYFYQLDGEGIRYEIVSFLRAVETGHTILECDNMVIAAIIRVMQDFYDGTDVDFV